MVRRAALLLFFAGCSNPVSVRPLAPSDAVIEARRNVIADGSLSAPTRHLLARAGLAERPAAAALAALRAPSEEIDARTRLAAAAELRYQIAEAEDTAAAFLDCARIARSAITAPEPPSPFDPAFGLAVELHNRALGRYVVLGGRAETRRPFTRLISADEMAVTGFQSRHRRPGIGAAVVAVRGRGDDEKYFGPLRALTRTIVLDERGTPRLLDPRTQPTVATGPHRLPVAADFTASHGYLAASIPGRTGFDALRGDAELDGARGIYLIDDYDPERVPVVLVHGLGATPLTWRDLANDIQGDPTLRDRFQAWHYFYPTGTSLLVAAADLRRSLREVRAHFGVKRDFVLVGHSLGGVLSRLAVQTSGDRIWDAYVKVPMDQLDLTPEERAQVRETVFFEPLPFVSRAVFACAPHRGSELAGSWIGRGVRGLITLPHKMVESARNLRKRNAAALRNPDRELSTSVDDLSSDNPMMALLAELPIAVPFHTIVGADDAVVARASSHLDGAASETVIPGAGHSAHQTPAALAQLRRILRRHATRP